MENSIRMNFRLKKASTHVFLDPNACRELQLDVGQFFMERSITQDQTKLRICCQQISERKNVIFTDKTFESQEFSQKSPQKSSQNNGRKNKAQKSFENFNKDKKQRRFSSLMTNNSFSPSKLERDPYIGKRKSDKEFSLSPQKSRGKSQGLRPQKRFLFKQPQRRNLNNKNQIKDHYLMLHQKISRISDRKISMEGDQKQTIYNPKEKKKIDDFKNLQNWEVRERLKSRLEQATMAISPAKQKMQRDNAKNKLGQNLISF